jgi:hypothetical protein
MQPPMIKALDAVTNNERNLVVFEWVSIPKLAVADDHIFIFDGTLI